MVRTTMTLEDDVAEALRALAHERRKPFKQVVNETLRQGLAPAQAPPAKPYTTVSAMGVPKEDLTKALQLASELEDQEIISKLAQGR
jgi:hypothetical protein